jgi:predicted nucleic acid-binding protein
MAVVAVVDTNVWVSAFLNPSGFPARLIQAGKSGRFSIVGSLPLLDEYVPDRSPRSSQHLHPPAGPV